MCARTTKKCITACYIVQQYSVAIILYHEIEESTLKDTLKLFERSLILLLHFTIFFVMILPTPLFHFFFHSLHHLLQTFSVILLINFHTYSWHYFLNLIPKPFNMRLLKLTFVNFYLYQQIVHFSCIMKKKFLFYLQSYWLSQF